MKFQLTLTSVICLSLAGYLHLSSSQTQKLKAENQQLLVSKVDYIDDNFSDYNQDFKQALMIKKDSQNLNNDRDSDIDKLNRQNHQQNFKLDKDSSPQMYQSAVGDNYMSLEPTGQTNNQGNPLYRLNLYVKGQLTQQYLTVTGRSFTQNRNRNQSGTEAPLPDGRYTVSFRTVPATHIEVGGRFLPIEPTFRTGRTYLGIHYDPSYNKSNGEDGTAGCIALTNKADFDRVLDYISSYRPQYLTVDIQ